MPVYQFAVLCLLIFIGICSTLLLIVRLLLPRHDYRDETQDGFPEFDSKLEPLSIGEGQAGRDRQVRGAGGVSLGELTDINTARGRAAADYVTGPPACRSIRVHRRERATLPARRGDR